jgi:hypothetical protein
VTTIEKIKSLVSSEKVNITDFCKKINISRDGFYKLNNDSIKLSTIEKIADYFNKPVCFFIDDKHKSALTIDDIINFLNEYKEKEKKLLK